MFFGFCFSFSLLLNSSSFFLVTKRFFFFNLRICHKTNSSHFQTLEEEENHRHRHRHSSFSFLASGFFAQESFSKLHFSLYVLGASLKASKIQFPVVLWCGKKENESALLFQGRLLTDTTIPLLFLDFWIASSCGDRRREGRPTEYNRKKRKKKIEDKRTEQNSSSEEKRSSKFVFASFFFFREL